MSVSTGHAGSRVLHCVVTAGRYCVSCHIETVLITTDPAVELRHVFLSDAARLTVAIVSSAIGPGSILVQWLRRKTQDRVRLWFGLLALLYGYRVLLMTQFSAILCLRTHNRLPDFPHHLHDWHSRGAVWLGLVSQKHNWVTKSLLTVNAFVAAAFLMFFNNLSVVYPLFVMNNFLVIAFLGTFQVASAAVEHSLLSLAITSDARN